MNPKTSKAKTAKMPKILFIICIIAISGYILYEKGYIPRIAISTGGEEATLQYVKDIVEVDVSKNNEFIVNDQQLIWVTEDGLKSFTLDGQELWADTHTMKTISIAQKTPYFAISEKMGHTISLFGLKGKKTDIKFANPVVYFSLNKKGDVVAIEKTQDGHVVSGYDEKGNSLGIKRITYIEDAGYPIAAEISPNGQIMMVSYLNTGDVKIVSNIIAIAIGSGGLTKVDNILHGASYEDTIISQIEFINENTWLAIGDNYMGFNNLDGEEIRKIQGSYYKYATRLNRVNDWQGISYAVINSTNPLGSTVHPVEKLIFYSQEGEEIEEITLNDSTSYLYGDGKTIVLGQDRKFIAYNRLGKKRWEYTATKDIQELIPLYPNQQVIMISKGKAELMQVIK